MAVEQVMTTRPITVRPETSLRKALQLLRAHGIRHLPVVQGRRLVGIITDRDLHHVLPSSLAMPEEQERFRAWGAHMKVGEIMTRRVLTVTPETRTDKAARLMAQRRIGCLPVLQGTTLVGIVTTVDLLRAMVGGDQFQMTLPKNNSSLRRTPLEDRRAPRAESKRPCPS
ncbi:MAG: CBS domain-containing protein [Candidatus Methylomirabilales bacterium]